MYPPQIKGLANWATAQSGTKGSEALLSRHHSRLIMTLVRCLRISFTGGVAVAGDDLQYAGVAGTGESIVRIVIAESTVRCRH